MAATKQFTMHRRRHRWIFYKQFKAAKSYQCACGAVKLVTGEMTIISVPTWTITKRRRHA